MNTFCVVFSEEHDLGGSYLSMCLSHMHVLWDENGTINRQHCAVKCQIDPPEWESKNKLWDFNNNLETIVHIFIITYSISSGRWSFCLNRKIELTMLILNNSRVFIAQFIFLLFNFWCNDVINESRKTLLQVFSGIYE